MGRLVFFQPKEDPMSSKWDEAKKRSEESKNAGQYVKLADHGDKFIGAFVGDPDFREYAYNEKTTKYEAWTAELEAAGKTKVTRYLINVYVLKTGTGKDMKDVVEAERVKIWECNNKAFTDICKVKEKFGLDAYFFEVERNGKKGDSKTSYTILPEVKIDDATKKLIAAAKLHDLEKADAGDESTDLSSHDKHAKGTNGTATAGDLSGVVRAAQTPPPAAAPLAPPPAASPETIDPETSSRIIGRLKALPREKIEAFLARFGIAQIKLLKRADVATAETWLSDAEGKPAAIDPFA
jgi:hypothetical protein